VLTKKKRGRKTFSRARFDDICSMMRAHILPAFGKERVGDIATDLLDDYVAYKTAPDPASRRADASEEDRYVVREGARRVKRHLEPATIRDHIELISQMYRWGAEPAQNLTPGDPTVDVSVPDLPKSETKPLEPEHALLTLELMESGTPRTLGTVFVACGVRLAEGLGVPESAYTPKKDGNGALVVRRFLKRCGGKMEPSSSGKTDGAGRELTLPPFVADLIEEQIHRNRALPVHDGCLFPSTTGTAWNPSNYRNRHWTPAVNTAYVKIMHPIERERWLAKVPDDLRDVAEILTLQAVTVRAVATARFRDIRGGALWFTDVDGNERSVILPEDVADRLSERAAVEKPSGYLLPRRNGRKIKAEELVRLVFTEPFRQADMEFDQRIHRARHTFASMAGVANPDLPAVELQRQLGHSNAASREVYVHSFKFHQATPVDVISALKSCVPDASSASSADLELTAEEMEVIRVLRRRNAA
jgi:integrase